MLQESKPEGGRWELPGGGLDFGETFRSGFEREVAEEMGVPVSAMSAEPVYAWTFRTENKRRLPWFHVLVLGFRVEFEHLDFTPSPECAQIGFFSKEELSRIKLTHQSQPLPTLFDSARFAEPMVERTRLV